MTTMATTAMTADARAGARCLGAAGPSNGVTIGHNNAPVALHFPIMLRRVKQPKEAVMRDGMGRQATRVVLAIGLLATLAGCVVYPAWGPGPGYGPGYRPYGYYYR